MNKVRHNVCVRPKRRLVSDIAGPAWLRVVDAQLTSPGQTGIASLDYDQRVVNTTLNGQPVSQRRRADAARKGGFLHRNERFRASTG